MTTTSERPTVVMPADWVPGPKQGDWTYSHYATLPDDGQRYEIINGVLFLMAPSPNEAHQSAVLEIASYLRTYVKLPGLGRVYIAPFDVELSPKVVVQPDVMVVLNAGLEKVVSSRIKGAPDLVVEVSSPGTARHERRDKEDAYARAGVPEYWFVYPMERSVELLILEGGTYKSLGIFSGEKTLPSIVVPTIEEVPVAKFFI